MEKELRVILVEDLPTDAELVENVLKKEFIRYKLKTTDTMLDFIREVKEFQPDLILSDYMLPQFTAIEALAISQKYSPAIPFIIVSGAVDDETAVHLMKNGAWDYVRKERLAGLGPAITRALELKKNRDEKEKAEQKLKESESRFRRLFESNMLGMAFWDISGEISEANDLFLQLTGYTREELLEGKINWEKMTPPEYADLDRKGVEEIKEKGVCTPFEKEYIRKDGSHIPVLIGGASIEGKSSGGVTYFIDITERKQLSEQLQHAQKMEAVGQLAGGVAHDFNNLLNAIVNYASIIKKQSLDNTMIAKEAEQIINISMKGSDITRGLLAFSRKHVSKRMPIRLNESIENIKKLLSKFIHENIHLNIQLSEADPVIMADSVQIDQIIINLATNARDAMPDGGSFTIETKVSTLTDDFIKTHGFGKAGHYTVLTATDTGSGIDTAIKQKIFDPFFTTKDIGEGTGLGLSIVYGIVKDHSGFIIVDSEEGRGTTFVIYFPVIEAAVREIKSEKKLDLRGNSETILVADDEESIRHSTKAILIDYGYNVIDAVDGKDAVEKFIQNQDKVSLLILDSVMPEKNGKDAYEEICSINPSIKAIFTSGYPAESFGKKHKPGEKNELLLKPVMPDVLLSTIKSALSSES